MAMLAEPRRKQKYSDDPRNLNWSKDDNRFGQKLMERMGWQKGKGLGANEDGNTEHIKVHVKNDTTGVGCTKDYADNWVAHQDEFNALLSSLNSSHTPEEPAKTTVQNLEEVSKSLKGRIHYKKFARGKDLTNARDEDLNCIFGRRKSKSTPSQNQSELNSEEDESDTETTKHGITTIRSSTSVQDYFKQKLAAMKAKSQGLSVSAPASANESSDEEMKETADQCTVSNDSVDTEQDQSIKKKKSKTKSKDTVEEGDNVTSDNKEEETGQAAESKKRKKHKRKHGDDERDNTSDNPEDVEKDSGVILENDNIDTDTVNTESNKKKKKKQKRKFRDEKSDSGSEGHDTDKSERKKSKKRKHKEKEGSEVRESGCIDEEHDTHSQEQVPKKKKRKNKSDTNELEENSAEKLEIKSKEADIDTEICDSKDDKDKHLRKNKSKTSQQKKANLDAGEKFSRNPSKYFKGSNLGNVQGYGR